MGETQHNPKTPSRRMELIHAGGEIVEVQGGHIVRSTGRKDRHSKVCTSKGTRDRRVRLSAHTAIQFYDVQDRLGYDRPSKALDWLIKKAKAAIDELEKLPAWNPTSSGWAAAKSNSKLGAMAGSSSIMVVGHDIPNDQRVLDMGNGNNSSNNTRNPSQNNNSSSFLPPSLDSDSIADTIKSFFLIGGSSAEMGDNSSPMQFHSFPPPSDLRTDLFASSAGIGFDISSANWSEHQKMVAWNVGGDGIAASIGEGVGGFDFNSPPLLQALFIGQNQNDDQFVSSQRGPLQSSNTPSIRAWIDPSSCTFDHHHYHHQNLPIYPSSFRGFSGFHIPARIQGEEEHGGISEKLSSASSDSRH